MSRPAGASESVPSRPLRISASRFSRLMAMVTAGAETFSQRASVAGITGSPSLSASAMALR